MYYDLIWGSEPDVDAEVSSIVIFNFAIYTDYSLSTEQDPSRSNEYIYIA